MPDPERITDQTVPAAPTFLSDATLVAEALEKHLAREEVNGYPSTSRSIDASWHCSHGRGA